MVVLGDDLLEEVTATTNLDVKTKGGQLWIGKVEMDQEAGEVDATVEAVEMAARTSPRMREVIEAGVVEEVAGQGDQERAATSRSSARSSGRSR